MEYVNSKPSVYLQEERRLGGACGHRLNLFPPPEQRGRPQRRPDLQHKLPFSSTTSHLFQSRGGQTAPDRLRFQTSPGKETKTHEQMETGTPPPHQAFAPHFWDAARFHSSCRESIFPRLQFPGNPDVQAGGASHGEQLQIKIIQLRFSCSSELLSPSIAGTARAPARSRTFLPGRPASVNVSCAPVAPPTGERAPTQVCFQDSTNRSETRRRLGDAF